MSQNKIPSSRRARAGELDAPVICRVGNISEFNRAWSALQARKPDKYGQDTRNPRWRMRT